MATCSAVSATGSEAAPQRELAPEWEVSGWLNTDHSLSLTGLRGRVVLAHAFQMLCPGCVSHGVPQAGRAHRLFAPTAIVRGLGLPGYNG